MIAENYHTIPSLQMIFTLFCLVMLNVDVLILSHMLITTEYKFQSPVSKTCYGLKLNHSICKSTVEFSYFKTIHKFSKHQSVDMFFIVDFHPTACYSFNCGWKKVFLYNFSFLLFLILFYGFSFTAVSSVMPFNRNHTKYIILHHERKKCNHDGFNKVWKIF